MRKVTLALALCLTTLFACNSQVRESSKSKNNTIMDSTKVVKSEEEWKKVLTPEQYSILREKGTDRPFTGKYYLTTDKGTYLCAACGAELFTSDMKFESSCGWPSFDKEILGGKVKTQTDYSHGMVRTEILCARCGGHLGHLFDDGPTDTGKRYCVNSTSLNFVKAK
ncbi:MAG TPA: peptide-methionine (R)-S-oxide reductase MsrB [Cyclobacteriaceae bacterium]